MCADQDLCVGMLVGNFMFESPQGRGGRLVLFISLENCPGYGTNVPSAPHPDSAHVRCVAEKPSEQYDAVQAVSRQHTSYYCLPLRPPGPPTLRFICCNIAITSHTQRRRVRPARPPSRIPSAACACLPFIVHRLPPRFTRVAQEKLFYIDLVKHIIKPFQHLVRPHDRQTHG